MSLTRRWLKRLLPLLLLGGLLTQAPRPARAHPADMYTQTYVLRVGAEGATLDYGLSPGPLLAASTWYEADTDGDDQVSAAEARAWLAPLLAAWQSRLGEASLDWTLTAVSWPTTLTAFELGDEQIAATLTTAFVAPAAGTPLTLQNDYAAGISIHWFYVYGEDGVTFTRPEQANGRVALALTPPGASPAPLGYWDSGTPALAAGTAPVAAEAGGDTAVAPAPAPTAPEDRRPYAVLTDLVRRQEASPLFLLTALGISLVLGAMHGLTPGHGKALVAAYLVGSRGTPRHAAALGGVVTLTHTGSVLAVGLLTLAASRFLVPTDLFPILELASGLLIMAMGVGLLVQRWRGWRSVRQKRAAERAAVVGEARRLGSGERRLGSGE
ncbi:MAG: hypothetical protein KC425_13915, partial [Anaerolineales bacterium]|nr:hypothetical protein [Anaerolineales bacterium]